jgi:hypothetical protein
MRMRRNAPPRVYVIETNGKALVAFEAVSGREANELLKEEWFHDELLLLRSATQQVWDGASVLTTRIGNDAEIAEFKGSASRDKGEDLDGLFLAYLIPIDGPV